MRLDQSNTLRRSSWGTPSSSAMTRSGSSAEISSTKSAVPLSQTASMIPSAYPTIRCFEVAHHPWREAVVDQPAVAGVQRRIHVEHHQLLLSQLVVIHLAKERRSAGGGEPLPVLVDGDAVLIIGDGPKAASRCGSFGVPVDGGLPAELAEPLERHPRHKIATVREVDLLERRASHGTPFSAAGSVVGGPPPMGQFLERVSVIIGTASVAPAWPYCQPLAQPRQMRTCYSFPPTRP